YQQHFSVAHKLAAGVVAAVAGGFGRPPHVLEVGAGYGSLTGHVLPLLSPEGRFVFTDVSSFFLDRAKERLAGHPWLEYGLYDMDWHPQVQGFERHDYDLVLAASVLHTARDLRGTLRHLRSLLAPGGLLLLIEETRFFPFFDLGMGLQQGFDD